MAVNIPSELLAGDILDADGETGRLNVTLGLANRSGVFRCTTDLPLTTSYQDVAGCTTTFTVSGANSFALCAATIDTNSLPANAVTGQLVVDGTAETALAILQSTRPVPTMEWQVDLGAGSHTIKLQAKQSGTAATIRNDQTYLRVLVVDKP